MSTILILDDNPDDLVELAEFLYYGLDIDNLKIIGTSNTFEAACVIAENSADVAIINISCFPFPQSIGDGLARLSMDNNIGTILISPCLSDLRYSALCWQNADFWVHKDDTFQSYRTILGEVRYLLRQRDNPLALVITTAADTINQCAIEAVR